MKKIITLILVLVMAFGLCACAQRVNLDNNGYIEFSVDGEKIAGSLEGYSVHQNGDNTFVVIDIANNK